MFNTNRLNLSDMVDKNFQDVSLHNTTIDLYSENVYPKQPLTNKFKKIESALNNIVETVHHQLESSQQNKILAASRDYAAVEKLLEDSKQDEEDKDESLPTDTANDIIKKQPVISLLSDRRQKRPKCSMSIRNLRSKTISQLQADMEQKNFLYKRRDYNAHNDKRIMEVMKQKRILEGMLWEHKKLKEDRESIARELSSMRFFLDGIRDKLDMSLKKINTRKLYCETCPSMATSSVKAKPKTKPKVTAPPKPSTKTPANKLNSPKFNSAKTNKTNIQRVKK